MLGSDSSDGESSLLAEAVETLEIVEPPESLPAVVTVVSVVGLGRRQWPSLWFFAVKIGEGRVGLVRSRRCCRMSGLLSSFPCSLGLLRVWDGVCLWCRVGC